MMLPPLRAFDTRAPVDRALVGEARSVPGVRVLGLRFPSATGRENGEDERNDEHWGRDTTTDPTRLRHLPPVLKRSGSERT